MIYRKKIALMGIVAASTLAVAVGTVPALAGTYTVTQYIGFDPTPISLGVFGPFDVKAEKNDKWKLQIKSHGQTDVRVTNVGFAPGASSGWHSHPGPNLLTVKEGGVRVWEGSDPLCSSPAGILHEANTSTATWVDNGGSEIHVVHNASTTAEATIIAVAFYPHATGTPLVPAPTTPQTRPNNCAATGAPVN